MIGGARMLEVERLRSDCDDWALVRLEQFIGQKSEKASLIELNATSGEMDKPCSSREVLQRQAP